MAFVLIDSGDAFNYYLLGRGAVGDRTRVSVTFYTKDYRFSQVFQPIVKRETDNLNPNTALLTWALDHQVTATSTTGLLVIRATTSRTRLKPAYASSSSSPARTRKPFSSTKLSDLTAVMFFGYQGYHPTCLPCFLHRSKPVQPRVVCVSFYKNHTCWTQIQWHQTP